MFQCMFCATMVMDYFKKNYPAEWLDRYGSLSRRLCRFASPAHRREQTTLASPSQLTANEVMSLFFIVCGLPCCHAITIFASGRKRNEADMMREQGWLFQGN